MAQQDWHNSGVDCCSPFTTCLLSWFCPCVVYGRTHHRLHNDVNLNGYSPFNMQCAMWCGLSCCAIPWVVQMLQRSNIRERYRIRGNLCTDCLCAFCCSPCDLTQQDQEAIFRENEKAGFVDNQPGKVDGMNYQAQV